MKYSYFISKENKRHLIIETEEGTQIDMRLSAIHSISIPDSEEFEEIESQEHIAIMEVLDKGKKYIDKYAELIAQDPNTFVSAEQIIL